LYERTFNIYSKSYGAGHRYLAGVLMDKAMIQFAKGDSKSCDDLLQQALGIQRKQTRDGNAAQAENLMNRAKEVAAQKNLPAAKALYFFAAGMYEDALGPDDSHTAACWNSVSDIYRQQGKIILADFYALRAAAAAKK